VGAESVTAVVPHYGAPETPLPLLEALSSQVGAPELQVVVVDDASPEPFPALEGVEVVLRDVNGGFGAAVNTGAAVADGDLLLVLNSDLEIGPTFVADLVAGAHPWQPAVVSPRVVGPDGVEQPTGRHFPRVRHQVTEWLVPLARWRDTDTLHRAVGHDVGAREREAVVDWVVGAAILVPTADFRAVGGFDERFYMNSEEVDLQRRLRERGLPSVVLAFPSAVHSGGGSSDSGRRREWLVQSRLAYADKWGGRRRLQAALGAATAANLAWNTGRRLAGRDVAPLRTVGQEAALLRRGGSRGVRR
jgi:N-acetylglucosaminyl-diphospho-decaprenol L-rhamnosyltransferase